MNVYNDRLALISKVNSDIADWLQVSATKTYRDDKTNTSCRSDGRLKRHMSLVSGNWAVARSTMRLL